MTHKMTKPEVSLQGNDPKADIIDGKRIAAQIKEQVGRIIRDCQYKPRFAVIQIGNDPASSIYINNKIRACREIGIETVNAHLDDTITEMDLLGLLEGFNHSPSFHGILVQLPLPPHIRLESLIESINPEKDVDGFHPLNVGRLTLRSSKPYLHPCTPWGIAHILDSYFPRTEAKSALLGKKVVVIGQSMIVGRPLSIMLQNDGATVCMCDKYTRELHDIVQGADIIVSATGVAGLISTEMVKRVANPGLVVIDAGIAKLDNKIVGDAHPDIYGLVKAITPVPGGVGPVTISFLLRNILKAYCMQKGLPSPEIF